MSTIQELKNNLLDEGYCFGNIFDFLSSEEIKSLNEYRKDLRHKVDTRKEDYFVCRHNYQPPNGLPQDYNAKIPLSEVKEREDYCRENNLLVWQEWFEGTPPVNDLEFVDVPFEIFLNLVKRIYPEYRYDEEDYHIAKGDISLFEDGHFICKHHDGKNPGRICVILAYLTDESEYNDAGGELVLKANSGIDVEVKPFFGTFCILDFTKNNIEHSVNPVKNGFKRLCYINFITLKELNKII